MKTIFVVGIAFISGLVGLASGYLFREGIHEIETTVFPDAESRARDILSLSLVDPDSLQLRNTRFAGSLVCGEMNSRNRMGGYVGFRYFVVLPDTGLASVITANDLPNHEAGVQTLQELAHITFLIDPPEDEPSTYQGDAARREWLMNAVVFYELWDRCDPSPQSN